MIATCQHCHADYWRYRRDHPPPGYCTVPHYYAGPARERKPKPPRPEWIHGAIREHERAEHRSPQAAPWAPEQPEIKWWECEICLELDALLAESLAYHKQESHQ